MNTIGFWWDIKKANLEYYDIQYAAERTNSNCDLPQLILFIFSLGYIIPEVSTLRIPFGKHGLD